MGAGMTENVNPLPPADESGYGPDARPIPVEYVNQCGRCGSGIHYTDCIDCDGTGSPDPHDPEGWCPECEGDGFIAFCISSQDWCYANPLPGHENTPRNTVIGLPVEEQQ